MNILICIALLYIRIIYLQVRKPIYIFRETELMFLVSLIVILVTFLFYIRHIPRYPGAKKLRTMKKTSLPVCISSIVFYIANIVTIYLFTWSYFFYYEVIFQKIKDYSIIGLLASLFGIVWYVVLVIGPPITLYFLMNHVIGSIVKKSDASIRQAIAKTDAALTTILPPQMAAWNMSYPLDEKMYFIAIVFLESTIDLTTMWWNICNKKG